MTEQSNEIQSISDLTQILKELDEPIHGKTRFFRGQAKEWELLPRIYRKDEPYLIENEDKIIKDALTNCPDDFSPNDTLFEKLVKLQHYGYATRFLDLTANALVALYFACYDKNHHDENGELIILDIPDTEVKYWDSDTVAVLTALSLQNQSFSIDKYIMFSKQYAELKDDEYHINQTRKDRMYENISSDKLLEADKVVANIIDSLNLPDLSDMKILAQRERYQRNFLEMFNQQPAIISLLHDVRTDKPSFRPAINPTDLTRVLCVRAKLNNARISRQQGCFLLFGIDDTKLNPAKFPDNWQRKAEKNQKFIIKNKPQIMQELKAFGISKQTLFPELESQAQEIMAQYKPKK